MYTYTVEIDVDDDGLYGSGLALLDGVKSLSWRAGMMSPYDSISKESQLQIRLDNTDGRYSQEDTTALYYGVIVEGRLIRVRTIYNGTSVTMTELRIVRISSTAGDRAGEFRPMAEVRLVCTDLIKELLRYDYIAPLQQNVAADEVLNKLHDSAHVVWPSEKFYFFIDQDSIDGAKEIYHRDDTAFDVGNTSLEWVGDHLGRDNRASNAQRLIRDLLLAEVYGIYFFQPRTGAYTFYNRLHSRQTSVTTIIDLADEAVTAITPVRGRNPFGVGAMNELTISYEPRQQGVEGVVFTSDNVPIRVAASQTQTIRGKYRDPDNETASVGATDIIPLQRGVDFIGNESPDGTGTDYTRYIFISQNVGGSSIELVLYARKVGDPIYVTTLQARGTPLTVYNKETVISRDGDSIHAYGLQQQKMNLALLGDHDLVQNIAAMLVSHFATPTNVIDNITLLVTDDNAVTLQTLTIGDIVTIINSDNTHEKDYMIMSEQHAVNIAAGSHTVTYVTRNIDTSSIFTIDTSSIDGPDVLDL